MKPHHFIIAALVIVIAVLALKQCNVKPVLIETVKPDTALIAEIKKLRGSKYRDTIYQTRIQYEPAHAAVDRWHYDSSWSNVADLSRSLGDTGNLQQAVGHRLIQGVEDSITVKVQGRKIVADSMVFSLSDSMFNLYVRDSEAARLKVAENARKDVKKAYWRGGKYGGGIGFILGIILFKSL